MHSKCNYRPLLIADLIIGATLSMTANASLQRVATESVTRYSQLWPE